LKSSAKDNYDGDNGKLEVFQNGSYATSVVPELSDFSRLEDKVFEVEAEVLEFMTKQYPTDYSFVVCKLEGKKEYHPFGYIHDTLPSGSMFIPTMHYHTHDDENGLKQELEEIIKVGADSQLLDDPPKSNLNPYKKDKFSLHSAPYDQSTYNQTYKSDDKEVDMKNKVIDDEDEKKVIIPAKSVINGQKHEVKADWNHEIYCWNHSLAFVPSGFQFKQVKFRPHYLEMVHLPSTIEPVENIYAYKVHNYWENHDLLCSTVM
jgi:hypothetical protein